MRTAVLIDTDIGDDIDDALALAFAVRSPEIELVGVTTVFQCSALRARMAHHVLGAWGYPAMPVAAGIDRPLLGPLRPEWNPNQAVVLQGVPQTPLAQIHAVDLIRQLAARHDGLVLAAIGAMTNLAVALTLDPALAERVRVVAMAGFWQKPTSEWNVHCDPEALAMVLASGVPVDFVGLDVTAQCPMRATDLAALASAPTGSPQATLGDYVEAWRGAVPQQTAVLHDPLAIAAIFRPGLLSWDRGRVAVNLADPSEPRAVTRFQADPRGPHRVARTVDTEAFLDLFSERVLGDGLSRM